MPDDLLRFRSPFSSNSITIFLKSRWEHVSSVNFKWRCCREWRHTSCTRFFREHPHRWSESKIALFWISSTSLFWPCQRRLNWFRTLEAEVPLPHTDPIAILLAAKKGLDCWIWSVGRCTFVLVAFHFWLSELYGLGLSFGCWHLRWLGCRQNAVARQAGFRFLLGIHSWGLFWNKQIN